MVTRENIDQKFSLISVYDKRKLKYLCDNLKKHNYKFISTGSTCKKIRSLGFKCIELSDITGFKEILDGRVKTISHKIYGSILYKRKNIKHIKEFKELKIPKIDIVIINLYPFKKYFKERDRTKTIEMIDIGGPSLIRAASKNYLDITIITTISDYSNLVKNLDKNLGYTDLNFRKKMATQSFKLTSEYDQLIYKWFLEKNDQNDIISLKYGENPNQKSFIKNKKMRSILQYQISGKQISFNNIIDIDSGYKCLTEFNEPTCVIVKHTNPCGVSSTNNIEKSFINAFNSDPKSAFGGIVFLNRKVNKRLSEKISRFFFEVIVAPDFENGALEILKKKKNLILLKIKKIKNIRYNTRSTIFGDITQNENNLKINKKFLSLVTSKSAPDKSIQDIIFATKVAKHLKSNAIVLAKNKQTIGIGSGQTNRIDALTSAVKRMKKNFNYKNFVCSSDGFFPFTDSINYLNKNNCKIIAQPSGSINDKKIIEFALKNKISLYFLKNRLFKH